MCAEALDHGVFLAIVDFFLDFFEGEVDYVVVVELLGSQDFAEAEPEAVQEVDFVGGEVGRVRSENFVDLVPIRQVNFQIELGFLVA